MVTGFLGVGKTTALLDLFQHRPEGERWAVLVNEFGEIGIDGAILGEDTEYLVREIPGGCICCTSGPMLQVALVRLLREQRPDRLFIEPTGLAMPSAIVDMLRRPGLREALAPRAVITLVDPVKAMQPRYRDNDAWRAQIQVADVLVANKCDLASEAQIEAFLVDADQWFPPKAVVATTDHGRLDPAWLDLDPTPKEVQQLPDVHAHAERRSLLAPPRVAPSGRAASHAVGDVATCGWIFPVERIFDRARLESTLQQLSRPCDALPAGVMRVKGVFRLPGVWSLANGDGERLSFSPIGHRRDSRVEFIVPREPVADWEAVHALLEAAFLTVADVRGR